jgi:hypothetical protein
MGQWVEIYPNSYEEFRRVGSNPNNFSNIISNMIIVADMELIRIYHITK